VPDHLELIRSPDEEKLSQLKWLWALRNPRAKESLAIRW
jgi:hypothetical protein